MADARHNVSVSISGDVAGVQKALALFGRDLQRTESQARGTAARMRRIRLQAARDVASRGTGLLRGAAAAGGGLGLMAAFNDAKNFEKQLENLAVASDNLSSKFVDKLRTQVTDLSNKFGIGATDIAGYAQAVVGITGNTKLATSTMGQMAKIAFATNSEMGDLAGIVANLSGKLEISQDKFGSAFEILASQADKGSFELKDMAKEMNTVLVAASALGVRGIKGVRVVGALAQVARRAAGSSAEAGTALSRFFQQMVAKRSAIEKTFGITLADGAGNFKDMSVILAELVGRFKQLQAEGKKFKGGKDIAAKSLELFDVRGGRVFQQLVRDFSTAGGGQLSFRELAGIQAGGAIDRKAKFRRTSPAAQFDIELNKMRNAMRKHMLPVLKEAAKLMPTVGKALGVLLKNSRLLISLWLGVKGALFFRRLMAPVSGGGAAAGLGAGAIQAGGAAAAGAGAAKTGRLAKVGRAAGGAAMAALLAPLVNEIGEGLGDAITRATGSGITRKAAQKQFRRQNDAITKHIRKGGTFKRTQASIAAQAGGGLKGKIMEILGAATGTDTASLIAMPHIGGAAAGLGGAAGKDVEAVRAAMSTVFAGRQAFRATANLRKQGTFTTLQQVVGDKITRKNVEAAQGRFMGLRKQLVGGAEAFLKSEAGAEARTLGITPEQIASQLPEVMKIDAILANLKENADALKRIDAGERAPIKLFITVGKDTPGSRVTANAGNNRDIEVQQL